MEEQEKKQEHEELTRDRRMEKGSLKERQTLGGKLNKEKTQKKGNRREKCGETKKRLHVRRILTVHVAPNYSDIKSS